MTMPASGPISLGQANTELGRSATATLSMNDSQLRTLAGAGGSGTPWSMNALYGKSAGFPTVSLATVPSYSAAFYTTSTSINIYLYFNTNGTWSVQDDSGEINSGNWGTPTTTGGGNAYYIRFTLTASAPLGTSNPYAPAGWNPLSFAQYCSTSVSFFDIDAESATWTIEIATDSGGSNVIATRTGVQIVAVPGSPP